MNPFLQNIKQFASRLSLGQKVAITLVLMGGIGVLSGVAYWAGQPDYALLFGGLDPADASRVIESLDADGVKYQVKEREGGTAVFVPREKKDELRLNIVGKGLITQGPAGYELFDRNTIGMTDFMQKLNLKRALEGELSRTIMSMRQVESARVLLVIPERSPFRETQTQPSASVALTLNRAGSLGGEQIEGITQLVAGSVEGLSPAAVTLVDSNGNMLSDPSRGDEDVRLSNNQLRYQRAIEKDLSDKAQTMLNQIVGPGNALVRVSAMLDFTRTATERQLIDPESQTVVGEEKSEELGTGEAQATASVKNYELSRTVERTEKSIGDISYLTVSVSVNMKRKVAQSADGQQEVSFEPRTQEELQSIESLIKNAIGFNPDRGDRFTINQTQFDHSVDQQFANEMMQQRQDERLQLYLRYGLMVLALGLAVWLMRSATKKLAGSASGPLFLEGSLQARSLKGAGSRAPRSRAAAGPSQLNPYEEDEEEVVLVDDVYTSKLSPEAKARLKAKHLMFEEIQTQVLNQPDNTADLLRTWLVEDQARGL